MPIDPPSGLGALFGAFSPRAPSRTERPRRASAASSPEAAGGRDPEAQLRQIAAALDLSDAQSVDRARRGAVRVLLQREFGTAIREYPEWTSLVDRVAGAITATPDVDARLIAWIALLRD